MDWIEKVTNEGKLGTWNVIVAGKRNSTNGTWALPNGKSVNKINRSKKINKDELDNTLDIGVLRDPMDLFADVDIDTIEDLNVKELILTAISNSKAAGATGLRDRTGLDTTPQLIIYRVDQNSATTSETRRNLEADEDVVGISIYIPGGRIGTSYASSISIKMKNDIFDGDADLEGTDEN
jgi:hypothetical protein